MCVSEPLVYRAAHKAKLVNDVGSHESGVDNFQQVDCFLDRFYLHTIIVHQDVRDPCTLCFQKFYLLNLLLKLCLDWYRDGHHHYFIQQLHENVEIHYDFSVL